jgi:hypothetical protein
VRKSQAAQKSVAPPPVQPVQADNPFNFTTSAVPISITRKRTYQPRLWHLITVIGIAVIVLLSAVIYSADPETRTGIFGMMVVFAFLTFSAFVYFLPTLVAVLNRHLNTMAIIVLNILLGWTFLGWVVALVWACMDTQRK